MEAAVLLLLYLIISIHMPFDPFPMLTAAACEEYYILLL